MGRGDFGARQPLYVVDEQANARLRVFIYHQNKAVRQHILDHAGAPQWYLEHQATWSSSNIRARYWLAFVVSEYEDHFRTGRVDFVWPSIAIPGPPKELPPVPLDQQIDPLEADWRQDLIVVVEGSVQLEQILRSRFRARGRGLGELVESAKHRMPLVLREQLQDIAKQRNPIVHPIRDGKPILPRPTLRSRKAFQEQCDQAKRALLKL